MRHFEYRLERMLRKNYSLLRQHKLQASHRHFVWKSGHKSIRERGEGRRKIVSIARSITKRLEDKFLTIFFCSGLRANISHTEIPSPSRADFSYSENIVFSLFFSLILMFSRIKNYNSYCKRRWGECGTSVTFDVASCPAEWGSWDWVWDCEFEGIFWLLSLFEKHLLSLRRLNWFSEDRTNRF